MMVYIEKWILTVNDAIARSLIYNMNPPKVGATIKNLSYATNDTKQTMDVIRPMGQGKFPILVFIHGGGWVSGNKANYLRLCKCYANAGFLVFSLNYRLAPRYPFPAALQDITLAIEWIIAHVQQYDGDEERLFLAGDSAGAYCATWLAGALKKRQLLRATQIETELKAELIKGIILFYGIYNLHTLSQTGFPGISHAARAFQQGAPMEILSPIDHIAPGFPPVFITSSPWDWLHPQSLELAEKLKRIGTPVEALFFSKKEHPEARHAFMELYFLRCARIALAASIEFLKKLL